MSIRPGARVPPGGSRLATAEKILFFRWTVPLPANDNPPASVLPFSYCPWKGDRDANSRVFLACSGLLGHVDPVRILLSFDSAVRWIRCDDHGDDREHDPRTRRPSRRRRRRRQSGVPDSRDTTDRLRRPPPDDHPTNLSIFFLSPVLLVPSIALSVPFRSSFGAPSVPFLVSP